MHSDTFDTEKLTVSELHALLNTLLREAVPEVWLEAEISQLTRAASGHIYLTLKDESSQIAAVIWKQSAALLDFVPQSGMSVLCLAQPTIYPVSGRLQVVVRKLLPAGEGILQQRFKELKARLEAEGLFEVSRKRSLPLYPKVIGVVTSLKGAALHDILDTLKRRAPQVRILLIDSRVQGEGAAQELVRAIARANRRNDIDVLIVGRGGGSLEDLWAFNEEVVVRAIFASRIPIVSAVGHEVDISLADLAADLRAATPTAAAELVIPHRDELFKKIDFLEQRLSKVEDLLEKLAQQLDELEISCRRAMKTMLKSATTKLSSLSQANRALSPQRVINRYNERISEHTERLRSASARLLRDSKIKLDGLQRSLEPIRMVSRIRESAEKVRVSDLRLAQTIAKRLLHLRADLKTNEQRLLASHPDTVLRRGFAIVEDVSDGKAITSASALTSAGKGVLRFIDGRVKIDVG
jgi:exodeoxyribonuclease VII large subunit